MATIEELKVKISADVASAAQALDSMKTKLSSLGTSADKASSKITNAFNKIAKSSNSGANSIASMSKGALLGLTTLGSFVGGALSGIFQGAMQAIGNSIGDAVQRVDTLNNFPRVMQNMGISAETAQKSIDYLQVKLQGLPTTLDDAATAVQRFTAANGNLEASTKMFESVNNMLLASGQSTEKQAAALEQLSQAYTKGKPEMQDWKTLLQTIPGQLNQVAQAMNYADSSALYNALQKGDVSMNDFMKTVVRLNKEGVNGFASFEEQAAGATNGIQTSITNLKTAFVRGWAEILNAIGQTNIANFFKGVASAVGTATNYIIAFIRIVMTAINAIRALFGQPAAALKNTKSSADSAASSMAGVGAAADGATKSVDGTGKAAKKLAKQLAGFDEMNILKEEDNSSSGGSSGGGAGGADLSGIDFGGLDDLGGGVDKIQEAYDKLMGIFGQLDLSKWEGALLNFRDGATKAFEIIKRVGISAWDDLFLPLAKYTAENTIPGYIDAIGKALQKLNPDTWGAGASGFFSGYETYLEGIQDIWLSVNTAISGFITAIGNIVVPPALSIIGAALEGIGQFFKGIADGISEVWKTYLEPFIDWLNEQMQPIIEHIQSVMDQIRECEPLMEAIRAAGEALGVVLGAVFATIGAAIALVVAGAVWLVDAIINVGTWFGNVILGIIDWFKTLQQWVKDVFTAIDNFIRPIVEGIGSFFGAIFGKIGEIFAKLGEIAVVIWSLIWNQLNKILSPVVQFFQNIWNKVTGIFKGIGTWFGNVFAQAFNKIKAAFATVGSFFQGIWNTITGIFTKIGTTIGNAVSGAFKAVVNTVIGFVEGFINTPVRAINSLIDVINAVPGVNVGKLNELRLPRMAKGGVIDRATLAIVGERGREAVMPLENNTGWIDELAQRIASNGGVGGQNSEPIHITVNLGDETLVDKVIEGANDRSFLNNRLVFNI